MCVFRFLYLDFQLFGGEIQKLVPGAVKERTLISECCISDLLRHPQLLSNLSSSQSFFVNVDEI